MDTTLRNTSNRHGMQQSAYQNAGLLIQTAADFFASVNSDGDMCLSYRHIQRAFNLRKKKNDSCKTKYFKYTEFTEVLKQKDDKWL